MRSVLLLALIAACASESAVPPGPGTLATPFGHLWYNVVGTGSGTPVILLHGGPGFTSHYMNPLAALGDERPVIFYDQIGAGRSHGTVDSTGWTIPNFVAELDTLLSALGLERVHMLGHSWGTILAAEYWRAHPDRVASIIFASPALDIPAWLADANRLLQEMLADTAGPLADTVTAFYQRYLARQLPWSANLDSSFATANLGVYNYMWGPSEFVATGTLQAYDATPWLATINVPVLFTTGEFDEATPATVRRLAALISGAEFALIPNAAHITMHDNGDENVRVVREFLNRVDR